MLGVSFRSLPNSVVHQHLYCWSSVLGRSIGNLHKDHKGRIMASYSDLDVTSVYTLCRKPKHSGREGRAAEPPVLPMEDSRREVRVDRAPDAALKPKPAKHNKLHAFMGFRV